MNILYVVSGTISFGLLVYLVLTYVYLGQSALLEYVSTTASRLTLPFRKMPLSIGRIDLAPVLSAMGRF